jgi:hypothetical protein
VASDWELLERARQRRAAQIERFTRRQRKARKWINFAEIAEHYTKEDQSALPLDLLAKDLLDGVFVEKGHSLVLFLHPTLPPTRLTPERIEQLKDVLDKDWGRSYPEYCWIPRRLFERWRDQNRLLSSSYFEPINEPSLVRLKKQPKRSGTGWAVLDAIDRLWPDKIPKGLSAKERNQQVLEQLKRDKSSIPKDLAKAVQRALQKRRLR